MHAHPHFSLHTINVWAKPMMCASASPDGLRTLRNSMPLCSVSSNSSSIKLSSTSRLLQPLHFDHFSLWLITFYKNNTYPWNYCGTSSWWICWGELSWLGWIKWITFVWHEIGDFFFFLKKRRACVLILYESCFFSFFSSTSRQYKPDTQTDKMLSTILMLIFFF